MKKYCLGSRFPGSLHRSRFGPLGKPAGCRICGRSLTFHQQVAGRICDSWRCREAHLGNEMAGFRDQAAAMLGEPHPEAYPMVVVPDDPAGIGPQPQSRRQAHIELLYELGIRTLASGRALEPLPGKVDGCGIPAPLPILAQLCAVCRGACCHLGKEHAFLDVTAIHRFMSRSGLTDPLHIVYAYAARMPELAVIDGCMYQAHWGCTLPRWMRAGICNFYRCKGLKQAEQMTQQSADNRICVMVRENNRISRTAFVQPHRIRHYPAGLVETGDTSPTAT